jgi:hypothetical protein
MDRPTFLKKLDETLSEWEKNHRWGKIEVDVHDGEPAMWRATIQQKLRVKSQTGGHPNGRPEDER